MKTKQPKQPKATSFMSTGPLIPIGSMSNLEALGKADFEKHAKIDCPIALAVKHKMSGKRPKLVPGKPEPKLRRKSESKLRPQSEPKLRPRPQTGPKPEPKPKRERKLLGHILNLTRHEVTGKQRDAGVFDPAPVIKKVICDLVTPGVFSTREQLESRAVALMGIAAKIGVKKVLLENPLTYFGDLIGHFMSGMGITPYYAVTVSLGVKITDNNGNVVIRKENEDFHLLQFAGPVGK